MDLLSAGVTTVLLGRLAITGLPHPVGGQQASGFRQDCVGGTSSPVGNVCVQSDPSTERQLGLSKKRSVPSEAPPCSGWQLPSTSPVLPVSAILVVVPKDTPWF